MIALKGKSPESIVLRFVWLENLTQDYTNDEIGQIVRDLYSYAKEGAVPQQYKDRGMRGLWRSMKDGIDKDFAKYREKSEKATASANARWGKNAQASAESEMQSNTNASEKIQTHLTGYDGVHSHRTDTANRCLISPLTNRSSEPRPNNERTTRKHETHRAHGATCAPFLVVAV